MRRGLIWLILGGALIVPLLMAAQSPYLAYRSPIYIAAGFAGITAMSLLLLQPLLAVRALPELSPRQSRHFHRLLGVVLLLLVAIHIGGLWITSPPDVIDALTFTSPTPFSVWGVLAMWALIASALLVAFRQRIRHWRPVHRLLGVVIVSGTILHALLIEGTMAPWTKWGLSLLLGLAFLRALLPTRLRR